MELSPKQLINKFILNECTPEEVDKLIDYFQNAKIDSGFLEVEEVLRLLKERPKINKNQADAIYRKMIEDLDQKEKMKQKVFRIFPKRKWLDYTAVAVVFVVLLGMSFYLLFSKPEVEVPSFSSTATPVSEDVVRLQTEDGKVKDLSGVTQFQINTKSGKVIVEKENDLLRYHSNDVSKSDEIRYNTLTVPRGKKFEVVLEDGSYVMLNAGSSLRYPIHFPRNGERKVYLTGEAFFDISKDEDRTFKVHTDRFEILVTGTQFNTSSYAEETIESVVLVEGSVDLNMITDDEHDIVHLEPGQMVELKKGDRDQVRIKEVDTENYTAWMRGGLVFRDVTFDEMLRKMGRQYNVTIINNNKELSKGHFNASFENEPLETILHYFVEVYKLNFTKKGNTIIIH